MRSYLSKLVCLLGLVFSISAQAQMTITFPVERIVFQRDNNNRATVQIAGNYYQPVDKIEAKLTPLNGGNAIDWTALPSISNGFFSGTISATGGWYKLEVRGSLAGQVVASDDLQPFGVGEVFVIAGQSNAQGVTYQPSENQPSPSDPSDDRITIANPSNLRGGTPGNGQDPQFYRYDVVSGQPASPLYPMLPTFRKMSGLQDVAPVGVGSYYWGRLGELLTQNLNVPVLFYNGAFGGTTIQNWRESSQGQRTISRYCTSCADEYKYFAQGYPYNNLKNILTYYLSITGARTVLWMQGEADDSATINTPLASYVNDLTAVIQKSRQDLGYDQLSWVVARTSYNNGVSPNIIAAQTQVASSVPNVFLGPNTDDYGIPRSGGVHFYVNAYNQVAQGWYDALMSNGVFNRSTPKQANTLTTISAACGNTNTLTLSVPNQNPYGWSNGQNGATITVGQGDPYMAKMKSGNTTVFSLPYKVPDRPVIGGDILKDNGGSTYFCEGVTPTLQSNYAANNVWNTGATTPTIPGAEGGSYSFTYKDLLGCNYSAESIVLGRRSRPAKPSITADGPTSFCAGTPRVLATNETAVGYIWSNGATSKNIQPTTTSNYSVQVLNADQCRSVASDAIQITVNPIPAKPTIQANRGIDPNRNVTICANETVEFTSSPSDGTYLWNYNNAATLSISTNEARSYTVQTISRANCPSPVSDPVSLKVNPLPAKPTVALLQGKLAFCEGETVTLRAITSERPSWLLANQQVSNTDLLTARISGDYYAQATDANGCRNQSDKVTVSARPNPETPKIAQVGPYTLQAQANIPGTRNSWIMGMDTSTFNSVYFKPLKEGVYTVKSVIEYNVAPVGRFECTSALSQPFSYSYDPAQDGFSVYPNPSPDGNFTLETKENWKGAEVSVVTTSGVVLYSGIINEFNERKFISLGRLPGIFIIRIRVDGFERTKRLTILP